MPAQHAIDDDRGLICTVWSGAAVESELFAALTAYQRDIRSRFRSYHEVVDFSQASQFALSAQGLRQLARMATATDVQGVRTRLAIIVSSDLAFGLGRMYEAYRGLVAAGEKEVRVFKRQREALAWIGS